MGSYGMNCWFEGIRFLDAGTEYFRSESEIAHPRLTPILADSTWEFVFPLASDLPPKDLIPIERDPWKFGSTFKGEMGFLTIPRHGSRAAPKNWPQDQPPRRWGQPIDWIGSSALI